MQLARVDSRIVPGHHSMANDRFVAVAALLYNIISISPQVVASTVNIHVQVKEQAEKQHKLSQNKSYKQ